MSLWADSTPALIISGQEKREYVDIHAHRRMYGTQGFDIVHMVSKTTKYAKLVEAANIHDELEHAYRTTLGGRKGPVWLDIPFDYNQNTYPSSCGNRYHLTRLNRRARIWVW